MFFKISRFFHKGCRGWLWMIVFVWNSWMSFEGRSPQPLQKSWQRPCSSPPPTFPEQVTYRVSISETLSFGATTSEAISRVDGVDGRSADRQLHWNSRWRQLLGAQVVVLDALVRKAQATPGTAIGCGQALHEAVVCGCSVVSTWKQKETRRRQEGRTKC